MSFSVAVQENEGDYACLGQFLLSAGFVGGEWIANQAMKVFDPACRKEWENINQGKLVF